MLLGVDRRREGGFSRKLKSSLNNKTRPWIDFF